MLESLFNSQYCKIFKCTYFEENLLMAASESVFYETEKNQKLLIRNFAFTLKTGF